MREPALLALKLDACAYLAGGAPLDRAQVVALPAQRASWPAQALHATGAAGAAFHAVLADSVVRYFVVTPPQGLQRFAELRDYAQMRVAELFGGDSALWRVSADWSASRPFLCCAAPADLLAPLEAYAGNKLASAAPIFVRRCNAAAGQMRRTPGWFVCCVGGWVSAAYFEGGACHAVRSTALAQHDSLGRWLGQEALLANRPLTDVWLVDPSEQQAAIAGANVHRIGAKANDMRDLALLEWLATAPVAA